MIVTLRALERFLLPNSCIACGRSAPASAPDSLICDVCVSRMRPLGTGCRRCMQPIPPVGPCRFCEGWTPGLKRVSSAVWLGSEARAMVHYLKYRHCTSLASEAARAIARHGPAVGGGHLVPIPVGRKRLRQRGYNQTAEIARELAGLWQLPVHDEALVRVRETRSQTSLTPMARLANVAGAFGATPPRRGPSSQAIIVDDVLTTGATLAAAARALSEAGWRDISAVTFARAPTYEARLTTV